MTKKIWILVMIILVITACDMPWEEKQIEEPVKKPETAVPSLESLSPFFIFSHHSSVRLKVWGKHFTTQSIIYIDGREIETKYISDSCLSCKLESKDISGIQQPLVSTQGYNSSELRRIKVHVRTVGSVPEDTRSLKLPVMEWKDHALVNSELPHLAIDGDGNVYAAWKQGIYRMRNTPKEGDLTWFSSLLKQETRWSRPQNIGRGYISSLAAIKGNRVYLSWFNQNNHRFITSQDNGNNWNSINTLPFKGAVTGIVAADDGFLAAISTPILSIYLSTSNNYGRTWTKQVSVTELPGSYYDEIDNVSIQISEKKDLLFHWYGLAKISVSWSYEPFVRRKFFQPPTWEEEREMIDELGFPGRRMSMDVAWGTGKELIMAKFLSNYWENNNGIAFSQYTDNLVGWGNLQQIYQIKNNHYFYLLPFLERSPADGYIYCLWLEGWSSDHRGPYDLKFIRSCDNGSTWSSARWLFRIYGKVWDTSAERKVDYRWVYPEPTFYFRIGPDGELILLWVTVIGNQSVICFSKSIDNGDTWSNPEIISTQSGKI